MNAADLLAELRTGEDEPVATLSAFEVLAGCTEVRGHTVTRYEDPASYAAVFKHGLGPTEARLVVPERELISMGPGFLARLVAQWLERVHQYEDAREE